MFKIAGNDESAELSVFLSLSVESRSFFLKVIGSIEKSKSTEEEPSFFSLVRSFHPCKVQTSSLVKFHSERELKQ